MCVWVWRILLQISDSVRLYWPGEIANWRIWLTPNKISTNESCAWMFDAKRQRINREQKEKKKQIEIDGSNEFDMVQCVSSIYPSVHRIWALGDGPTIHINKINKRILYRRRYMRCTWPMRADYMIFTWFCLFIWTLSTGERIMIW